jgi:hypothetical protein
MKSISGLVLLPEYMVLEDLLAIYPRHTWGISVVLHIENNLSNICGIYLGTILGNIDLILRSDLEGRFEQNKCLFNQTRKRIS